MEKGERLDCTIGANVERMDMEKREHTRTAVDWKQRAKPLLDGGKGKNNNVRLAKRSSRKRPRRAAGKVMTTSPTAELRNEKGQHERRKQRISTRKGTVVPRKNPSHSGNRRSTVDYCHSADARNSVHAENPSHSGNRRSTVDLGNSDDANTCAEKSSHSGNRRSAVEVNHSRESTRAQGLVTSTKIPLHSGSSHHAAMLKDAAPVPLACQDCAQTEAVVQEEDDKAPRVVDRLSQPRLKYNSYGKGKNIKYWYGEQRGKRGPKR